LDIEILNRTFSMSSSRRELTSSCMNEDSTSAGNIPAKVHSLSLRCHLL